MPSFVQLEYTAVYLSECIFFCNHMHLPHFCVCRFFNIICDSKYEGIFERLNTLSLQPKCWHLSDHSILKVKLFTYILWISVSLWVPKRFNLRDYSLFNVRHHYTRSLPSDWYPFAINMICISTATFSKDCIHCTHFCLFCIILNTFWIFCSFFFFFF